MSEIIKEKINVKKIISLIINLTIVIMEVIGFYLSICRKGISVQYYTEDSNILTMITSLLFSIYLIKNMKSKENEMPNSIKWLKYMATTSLTVTFLVALFILVPTMKEIGGFRMMMLNNSMLFHHTICPILELITFIFFDNCKIENWKEILIATSFTIIYAIIMIILNVIHIVYGPYPFLHVYEQPIYMSILWCILIVGGSYVISSLLRRLSNKFIKNNKY